MNEYQTFYEHIDNGQIRYLESNDMVVIIIL
jgi:hypothetical protein